MVRPVESIRKDLNALEGATATLAGEFSQIYATYLTVLGQAMRRQVIMATYHLCTQVYPEEFLALAVSDRTRLQQGIQDLGRKAQGWLQQLMEPDTSGADSDSTVTLDRNDLNRLESALAAMVDNRAGSNAEGEPDAAEGEGEGAIAPPADSPETSPSGDADRADQAEDSDAAAALALDPKALVQSVIMAAISSEVMEAFSDRPFTGDPLTPTLVAKHHLILEQMIREVLHRASRKANQLLRRAQVIPDLPESVLEMASDVDVAMPKGRSAPNVLNVLVAMAGDVAAEFDPRSQDDDRDQEPEDDDPRDEDSRDEEDDEAMEGTMTHLAAVQLRLSDLEFGDVQAALWRGKLRTAVARLRKLGKQYQKAERELAIAQAEQAWRAVWYDNSSR